MASAGKSSGGAKRIFAFGSTKRRMSHADPIDVAGEADQGLVLPRRAALARQPARDLAVPFDELPVLLVARLVEEPDDVGPRHVLDLIDLEERGLTTVLLDFLAQPLELLDVLGRERQQVDGLLERDGAERSKLPPRPHPQARRMWRKADHQDQPRRTR